jgi:voltage-gated potassium channel
MMTFEKLSLFDAVWLTLTTLTTVGYGDFSATTVPGRLSTIILVFWGGIWCAFQSAATYFEYRADQRQRMTEGRWRWNMTNHILLLNVPVHKGSTYLARLVNEFRASQRFAHEPIQILSTLFPNGLPDDLADLAVVHHAGEAWDSNALQKAGATEADVIIVLSQSDSDPATDGCTLDIVDKLREMGAKGRILAECVDDENRTRFKRFGADIVVRPIRSYPEMIVRAVAAPGAEAILEDLFTSKGDEVWRYNVAVDGSVWKTLITALVQEDIGIPIAYRDAADGKMQINPRPDALVNADKLYVLVRTGNARQDKEIAELLKLCPKVDGANAAT